MREIAPAYGAQAKGLWVENATGWSGVLVSSEARQNYPSAVSMMSASGCASAEFDDRNGVGTRRVATPQ
jgi:hypothetical protein